MMVLNEHSQASAIEKLTQQLGYDYMWIFDLSLKDYTLTPIITLEEFRTPTFVVDIEGSRLTIPANWNVLIYDQELSVVDVVELAEAAGRQFTAFVYGPAKSRPTPKVISVVDYFMDYQIVCPSLVKTQMLCVPINNDEWITVCPTDWYNKYLKGCTVGDLIN
jgi:hypothetical protein